MLWCRSLSFFWVVPESDNGSGSSKKGWKFLNFANLKKNSFLNLYSMFSFQCCQETAGKNYQYTKNLNAKSLSRIRGRWKKGRIHNNVFNTIFLLTDCNRTHRYRTRTCFRKKWTNFPELWKKSFASLNIYLDSRRVVCVESPHAAAAGPAGPAASTAGGCGCAGSFPLASPPCPSSARPRWGCGPRGARSDIRGAGCWSYGHNINYMQRNNICYYYRYWYKLVLYKTKFCNILKTLARY